MRVNGRELDDAGDQLGGVAAAIVTAPPAMEWPTSTAGPPRCRTRATQVAGDSGAGVGGPADAGLAAAAQVERGDPVPGADRAGSQEAVGLAAVAHAVGEHDQRAGALTS